MEKTLIPFARACKEAREYSGLKGEELRLACERLVEERGELFRVLPSDISRYEKGAYLPSLQKFLGLLWLFGKPAEHYLKALGVEPEQVCSHNLSPEEQRLVDFIQEDSGRSELHRRLRQIFEGGTEAEKEAIETVVKLAAEKAASREEAPEPGSRKEPEPTERPSAQIIQMPQFINHDEPQELRTEELPYFEWAAVPASPPDFRDPDGYVTIQVLAHLAKGGRFVIRVMGDSMEPDIRDGDLVIVDGNIKYPKHGDTVVALINQKSTLKKFNRRARKITLHPLNPDHQNIIITETDDFQIQGVVVAITREMRR